MLRLKRALNSMLRMIVPIGVAILAVNLTACAPLLIGAGVGAVGGGIAAGTPGVRVNAPVKVTFVAPRHVAVAAAGSLDTALLADVRVLLGRVHRMRNDTAWIRLSEATSTSGGQRFSRAQAPVVAVPINSSTRIVPLTNRALYAASGALLGTLTAAIVVAVQCARTHCLD